MKDFKRIKENIELLSGSKKEIASALLEKAVFMDSELMELQKVLKKKGWVEEYQNGQNQKGLKKCSEGESYIQLSKVYASVMKQIESILPEADNQERDLLAEFLFDDDFEEKKIAHGMKVERR